MRSFAPPLSTIERNYKRIHSLSAYLLHTVLEQEISIGANADIAKTKREKQIVFAIERWMQLLRLKSQNAREASHHAVFMGICRLLVTRVSLIYLVDEFFFLFLVQLKETSREDESKVLSFYFWSQSGGMRKGGKSKISFCHPRGLRASTQTYHERGGVIQCRQSFCR